MTVVGLISDTHGRLDPLALAAMAEADYIIHAGDIGDYDILDQLQLLAPTTAVLGNNDYPEYGSDVKLVARLTIDGVRFAVAHYPHDVLMGPHGCLAVSPGDPIPQVCVHGHTHVPELLFGAAARPAEFFLCPGSASRPRRRFPKSYGRIEIRDGRIVDVRICSLQGQDLLVWTAPDEEAAADADAAGAASAPDDASAPVAAPAPGAPEGGTA